MGILQTAKPAIVICARNRSRSTAFYRDTPGLTLAYEDNFAAVFNIAGVTLRISAVPDFTPHDHTILGFQVTNVRASVESLRRMGVVFDTYPHFKHDDLGIWDAPGGKISVAWFKDPDGNVLSITNA